MSEGFSGIGIKTISVTSGVSFYNSACYILLVNKSLRFALGATGIIFVIIYLFKTDSPSDPIYRGKRFSVWLEELSSSPVERPSAEAFDAIKHIGTNALPKMVFMLTTKDSKLKKVLMSLARKQKLFPINSRDAKYTRELASMSFYLFGSKGQPAVPSLIALLNSGDRDTRLRAAEALAFIGPSASNAVPALAQLLKTNDDLFVQDVRRALGKIDTNGTAIKYMK